MSYKMVGAFLIIGALAIAFAVGGRLSNVKVLGSGSSFIYPQMSVWIKELKGKAPWITLNYNPVGSGTGQQQFLSGLVDFAASDPPLNEEKWSQLRGKVIQMPIVLGAVAVVYNVPEVDELRLDGRALALIYSGEVKYWDDPVILELNPGVRFPHKPIVAVHRSDSSGTTNVFTYFLYKAAPDVWPAERVGKTVDWPVDGLGNGVGSKGNQGVAQTLASTPYSLGYVELSYAIQEGMKVALIKNADGKFVKPTVKGIMQAAKEAFKNMPKSPLDDFSRDMDALILAPGEESYPITSFVHLIFRTEYSEEKVKAIRLLIEFFNTEGQEMIVEGYAPIPVELRKTNLKALEFLRVSSHEG